MSKHPKMKRRYRLELTESESVRFWSKVDKTPGLGPDGTCWLWTASTINTNPTRKGYGHIGLRGHVDLAHSVSYRSSIGEIPEGKTLDHTCRLRHCVNPNHLDPVTHKENVLRGNGLCAINAAKTHCIRGHAFVGDNIIISKRGHRHCRTCVRVMNLAGYHRRRKVRLLNEGTNENSSVTV